MGIENSLIVSFNFKCDNMSLSNTISCVKTTAVFLEGIGCQQWQNQCQYPIYGTLYVYIHPKVFSAIKIK